MDNAASQLRDRELEIQTQDAARKEKETEFNDLNNQRGRLQDQKEALNGRLADKWNVYGRGIKQVIEQVERQRWKGVKPIGPLGDYVELRDRSWDVPIKIAVGSLMSAWIVDDPEDRRTLKDILTHFRKFVLRSAFSVLISDQSLLTSLL